MYAHGPAGYPTPMTISSMTDDLMGVCATNSAAGSSAVWPSSDLALFYPIPVSDVPRTYTKAWWVNGSAVAGNVDVGIYTFSGATGTRVVASTAEAQSGVSVMQVAATFPATTLLAGVQYWIAMSCSSGTATTWKAAPAALTLRAVGCFQAATSHPLTASPTAVAMASSYIPLFGFSENAAV